MFALIATAEIGVELNLRRHEADEFNARPWSKSRVIATIPNSTSPLATSFYEPDIGFWDCGFCGKRVFKS
jgi:hypothetical protein